MIPFMDRRCGATSHFAREYFNIEQNEKLQRMKKEIDEAVQKDALSTKFLHEESAETNDTKEPADAFVTV